MSCDQNIVPYYELITLFTNCTMQNNKYMQNPSVVTLNDHNGFQESKHSPLMEEKASSLTLTNLDSATFNNILDPSLMSQSDSGFGTASTTSWPPSTPCPPAIEHPTQHTTTTSSNHQSSQQQQHLTQSAFIQPYDGSSSSFPNSTPSEVVVDQPCASAENNIGTGLLAENINSQALVQEMEIIITEARDDYVVLTNAVLLLSRFTVDSVKAYDVCQAMASSPSLMSELYRIIKTDRYYNLDLQNTLLWYAARNLTSLSEYENTRGVLLAHSDHYMLDDSPSPGVSSLLRLLQIDDINVIVQAMVAIHNLLLDSRHTIQQMAKQQIKHGIRYILALLDCPCLDNDQFKTTVLDCLQILAFKNEENKVLIKRSDGPRLIMQTIRKCLRDDNRDEELIETACKVLKSLSVCSENKFDIIEHEGTEVLTSCISITANLDIMRTCLWTLRNLSDLISNHEEHHLGYILHLVDIILKILADYADEQSIITCALGILFNLTCNNERIKQHVCLNNGVELLIRTIAIGLRETSEFYIVDKEIIEPAICALCHLLNQNNEPAYAENARMNVKLNFEIFKPIMYPSRPISNELCRAVRKLDSLTFQELN